MNAIVMQAQGLKAWIAVAAAKRRSIAGVEVTGETIGWLIAAIVLVSVGVIFASGAGTHWMNSIFGNVTSIQPTNVPTNVQVGG